jgi:hypothetical protein
VALLLSSKVNYLNAALAFLACHLVQKLAQLIDAKRST